MKNTSKERQSQPEREKRNYKEWTYERERKETKKRIYNEKDSARERVETEEERINVWEREINREKKLRKREFIIQKIH